MKLNVRHVLAAGVLCLFAAAAHGAPHGDLAAGLLRLPAPFRGFDAAADFDGDRRADYAVAESFGPAGSAHRYRVGITLSAHAGHSFDVLSEFAGGLRIAVVDVDGDHDPDLVISSEAGSRRVGVWINDGTGGFAPGDRSSYPEFIWHDSDAEFSRGRTVTIVTAFEGPAQRWAIEPNPAAVPVAAPSAPSHAEVAPAIPLTRQYTRSSRAPPLFS